MCGTHTTPCKQSGPCVLCERQLLGLRPLCPTIKNRYSGEKVNDIDGVKIDFAECWVHLRKSNTEPIIRIYTEAKTMAEADTLAKRFISEIEQLYKA